MNSVAPPTNALRRQRISPGWWLVAVAIALAGLLQLNTVRSPIPGLAIELTDDFALEDPAARQRIWTSQRPDGDGRGELSIGPLQTSHAISFYVSGHPRTNGNQLFLENRATGETQSFALLEPINFRVGVTLTLPEAWRGAAVFLRAIDNSTVPDDWISVSEPVAVPRWAAWFPGAPSRVCTFLFIGSLLSLCASAAIPLCRAWGFRSGPVLLIATLGLVAIAGQLAFWCFFATPLLGRIFTGTLLLGAIMLVVRSALGKQSILTDCEWRVPALLMVAIGTFDVAVLHHYAGEAPMSALAQHRFVGNMPTDNLLPLVFARTLTNGEDPRDYAGGTWRSSDRPPLQTGWLLLLARPAAALNAGYDAAMQSGGVWFQLLWIPAMWAWLRSAGTRPRLTASIILAVAGSGFFFFQTIYVWPKLGCAAFALAAFVLWFRVRDDEVARDTRVPAGAAAVSLAWLGHGGAAFSLLAFAPWLLLHRRSLTNARPWMNAFVVFVVLAGPWLLYQKIYDPPGDRLIKWHLAGVAEMDSRGTLETLLDAYQEKSWSAIVDDRFTNFRRMFRGSWSDWWRFDFSATEIRRIDEWFTTFFALGWWNLGLVALTLARVARLFNRSARWVSLQRDLGDTFAWALLTLTIWCTLMFEAGSTVIHLGSYAPLLVLFPLAALVLARIHPVAFALVAFVQWISFVGVWLVQPGHWQHLPGQNSAIVIAGMSLVAAAWIVWRAEAAGATTGPVQVGDTTAPPP